MIQANITFANRQSHPDGYGTTFNTADVYIEITDENGLPTNGNNVTVTVILDANTTSETHKDFVVPGMSLLIFSGYVSRIVNDQLFDARTFAVSGVTPAGVALPLICDAHIDSVTIDKKETNLGAADGQVTINAFSSYGPIMYSLDNQYYQDSSTFTNLAAEGYTAWIKDANNCSATYSFTLGVTKNLLVSDPSVDLGNGNISRWSAAFNPIVFTYQRKDFEVILISDNSIFGDGTLFTINGVVGSVLPGEQVYINAGAYDGLYTVKMAQNATLLIDIPYISSPIQGGFVNINSLFGYYNVQTFITYQDKLTGRTQTIKSTNRPDKAGVVKADLSSFLQSLLFAKDDSDYTAVSYRDSNLSASYTIAYQEHWTDFSNTDQQSELINVEHPYFITYTAQQLSQKYGGNMAQYVPFKSVSNPSYLAKWVTDFDEPAYSPGYPFDIGFIYSEYLLGLNPYFELNVLDINRNPITGLLSTGYLLAASDSYLLNQDSSKFIISNGTIVSSPVSIAPDQLGLNRLLINPNISRQAFYLAIALKYDDNNGTHTVTQIQTIRVDDAVDDRSVYLRWIGLTGSWNYYRFVYNQEITLDVQNAVIIKNFVADWENQQGIEEVISKSASEKMKVMAEDLSVADIKGLQSIKYSPKVQMLTGRSPVKWQTVVLNTATFAEYETRYGQYSFSVTFNLPAKNIQTQ